MDLIGIGWGPMAGICEQGNEPSVSKCRNVIELNNYKVFKEDTASINQSVRLSVTQIRTRVYPKVSGLAAWSESCKWYSPLSLGAVVSLFCESV
jgi:hypothetical protein